MAEVCANDGLAIAIAKRMAANEVNFFMVCSVAVTSGNWQVRSDLFGNRFETGRAPNAPGYRRDQNCLAKRGLCSKTHVRPAHSKAAAAQKKSARDRSRDSREKRSGVRF